ncbi:MAG TPA: STAS domain-containing protein [Acidimicrobiia bacterium]|nr:STAS domain-containing protein [Acidimicrobiia bacterium]
MSEYGQTVEVRLLEMPVDLWRRASAHYEAIQREFDIVKADLPRGSVPHQLSELLEELDLRFAGVGDPNRQELFAAAERGESQIDLVYRVPSEMLAAIRRLDEMLDAVDDFCRAGERLLTLATPPDLVAFRKWSLGEFTRQLENGQSPLAWSDFRLEPASARPNETPTVPGEGEELIQFEGDLDLASSGALRNRILGARGGHTSQVTLDLSRVEMVDSVGISLLITAHARLSEDGIRMRLILPMSLRRLFEISGIIEVLNPEFVEDPKEPALAEGH